VIQVNEKVDHINFGLGVIKEVKENKIWVQFEEEIRTRIFLYPDGFEKFLKAVNPKAENDVLQELHIRQEQFAMLQRQKEREAAELNIIRARLNLLKKRSALKSKKRKA
jgi:hypothetical protein